MTLAASWGFCINCWGGESVSQNAGLGELCNTQSKTLADAQASFWILDSGLTSVLRQLEGRSTWLRALQRLFGALQAHSFPQPRICQHTIHELLSANNIVNRADDAVHRLDAVATKLNATIPSCHWLPVLVSRLSGS